MVVWFLLTAAAAALTLLIAVGRAVIRSQQRREKWSMRDHLNRISRDPE